MESSPSTMCGERSASATEQKRKKIKCSRIGCIKQMSEIISITVLAYLHVVQIKHNIASDWQRGKGAISFYILNA